MYLKLVKNIHLKIYNNLDNLMRFIKNVTFLLVQEV